MYHKNRKQVSVQNLGAARKRPRLRRAFPNSPAEQVLNVSDLIAEQVQLARESLDLAFGTAVNFEVEFAAQPILGVLAILAHHDDGRLDGGEHRKDQVEKNERIGIPGAPR